ncbi:hypothetical protein M9H77_35134 [Catharanthus roseus]|uniref:Uncharacterized protein n=1 Tax=Catharanthus roseus TaxID=4058 RepID=A0ACB9ZN52_CATRO|nr:hypothetical protein M9H77_35134 [Catharanthus roseus]
MRRLAKGVLNPILPEDLGVTLTSPPEVAVTKGRKKTDSTKKDKSHCGSVSGSGSLPGSVSGSGSRGRGRPPRAPSERGRGRDRGRNSLSALIHASPCSTFPYTNAFPAFIYPFISNWKNVIGDRNCGYRIVADFVFGDEHQWPELQLNDMCLISPLYVQWIYHRSEWINNLAYSYQHRIAYWNARVARNKK